MNALNVLIYAVIFPGEVLKQVARKFACDITGVEVFAVKYFQLKNPGTYLIHRKTESPLKMFLISYFPFFVNTILGMVISAPGCFLMLGAGRLMEKPIWVEILSIITIWIGLSILVTALPRREDAKNIWKCVQANSDVSWPIRIITAPVSAVGMMLTTIHFQIVYAGIMAEIIPMIITNIMFAP